MPNRIGLILLAAGGSTRMGRPKQLLILHGRTLLRRAAEAAAQSICEPLIVVLGPHATACRKELDGINLAIVENEKWEQGMGTSIATGMQHLMIMAPDAAAVILMVCDQPSVDEKAIAALIGEYEKTSKLLVGSRYAGVIGVPALFSREFFEKLKSLPTGKGAQSILRSHPDQSASIELPEGAVDIDTPEDFERQLMRKLANPLGTVAIIFAVIEFPWWQFMVDQEFLYRFGLRPNTALWLAVTMIPAVIAILCSLWGFCLVFAKRRRSQTSIRLVAGLILAIYLLLGLVMSWKRA